jgi:hypothetical protein
MSRIKPKWPEENVQGDFLVRNTNEKVKKK